MAPRVVPRHSTIIPGPLVRSRTPPAPAACDGAAAFAQGPAELTEPIASAEGEARDAMWLLSREVPLLDLRCTGARPNGVEAIDGTLCEIPLVE